ncbi:MAG: polyprenyl synthetase family protein [Armatimonadota bacterium]
MELKQYLKERKAIVDAALDRYLPPAADQPGVVHEAMRYSTIDGGKRIRPILTLAGCDAVGGRIEMAMPAACALECIHAFSLIHDDLPCMDDDDLRRGRPTSHKVFGEAMALLAGDALFAFAFQMISETPKGVTSDVVLEVWRRIAEATGTNGMVGGQVMDMLAQGRKANLREIEQIHRRKTGALLEVAVVIGGMLGGGSKEQVDALSCYGRNIGLAFQIADDILDIKGDAEKLGKPIGSDLEMGKATYPSVIGIEKSMELAKKAMDDAIAALSIFDEKAGPLREIAKFVVERDF